MSGLGDVSCCNWLERLGLVLKASFGWVSAGELEGEEHFAGLFGVDLAGGEAGNHHGEGVLDRLGAAQRV